MKIRELKQYQFLNTTIVEFETMICLFLMYILPDIILKKDWLSTLGCRKESIYDPFTEPVKRL